jgi:hypothetical protein
MCQKIKITLTIVSLLGLLLLLGCIFPGNSDPVKNDPVPNSLKEVEWSEAIEILSSRQVVQVFQSHSLEVILTLENGSQIKTIEPIIDEIFKEIGICGEPCSEMILITE